MGPNITYAVDTFDKTYISYMIKHIETEYVAKFILEAYRALKPVGALTTDCHDEVFLFQISPFNKDYRS